MKKRVYTIKRYLFIQIYKDRNVLPLKLQILINRNSQAHGVSILPGSFFILRESRPGTSINILIVQVTTCNTAAAVAPGYIHTGNKIVEMEALSDNPKNKKPKTETASEQGKLAPTTIIAIAKRVYTTSVDNDCAVNYSTITNVIACILQY